MPANTDNLVTVATAGASATVNSGQPSITGLGMITTSAETHSVSFGTFYVDASKSSGSNTVTVEISYNDGTINSQTGPVLMDQGQNTEIVWTPDVLEPASIALHHEELAGQVFLRVAAFENQHGSPSWTVGALDWDHESSLRKAWRHFLGIIEAGGQAISDFIAWITGQNNS